MARYVITRQDGPTLDYFHDLDAFHAPTYSADLAGAWKFYTERYARDLASALARSGGGAHRVAQIEART